MPIAGWTSGRGYMTRKRRICNTLPRHLVLNGHRCTSITDVTRAQVKNPETRRLFCINLFVYCTCTSIVTCIYVVLLIWEYRRPQSPSITCQRSSDIISLDISTDKHHRPAGRGSERFDPSNTRTRTRISINIAFILLDMSAPNNPNPSVDDGTINTHNPTTGDKTTSHLPPGTNPMADRTDVFDHNDQQSGQGNPAGPQGTQSHNTHNPLTGDKTGPNPPGTNPVTGRTNDGELGRNEQQYGQGRVTGPQGAQSHNTHNSLTGEPDNTHNPMTGDKTGPDPPPGTSPVTGRTRDGESGRDEQQYGSGSGIGERTGPNLPQGTNWATGGTNQGEFGRNEQQYGQGAQAGPQDAQSHNTYNPSTNDKTGPHPQGTNQATGRTNDGEFGRNEQHYGQGGQTGPQDTQSHNTHNPLTGGSPDNTHNPMTGDKTGPNPPPGTNPVTGRTRDGELGRDNQQYGQGGGTGPQGTQSQNTHNPLTGGGPDNTHNPMTGNTTGPNPPPGTNPVTGRTGDGELGRNEQQNDPGSGIGSQGAQAHNTHNPLIGGGRTNTHNPFTGDKTGPNPPSGTNPVTGRTRDGELGQNEQQHLGGAGVGTTGLTGAGRAGQNT
ncbi:hypothetical protein FS749_012229, partial [Ceratobasidium sp. UAMH 11750]